ncbi:tripeptidyl-peptidase 1 precursor [Beauveria brongniartii RCEF 3172]|uniref:tripeptidyl-peptidase II n=1 Tax=Beauveria brongniartii RCEF 3172 TaxID=1081107 RepID=A0A162JZA5_9HYPO|nr:tripeptidyl-peptidase 1 precursor [Beauveria brongniartii RCEF 3172]
MTTNHISRLTLGVCLVALALAAATYAHSATTPAVARLTIGLVPGDDALLQQTVHELSDPTHPRYGQYLSREAALDLLQPGSESLDAVRTWLRDAAGLHDEDLARRGQFLHANVSASQVASLLVKPNGDGAFAVADEAARKHIRAMHLDNLDHGVLQSRWHAFHAVESSQQPVPPPSKDVLKTVMDRCEGRITPACLRKRYHMDDVPSTPKKTILGVLGFGGQTAQYADLDLFLRNLDPSRVGSNFTEALLNGGKNQQGQFPAAEGNLDIQYAVALAGANVDVRFLSVGGRNLDFIPDLDLPKGKNSFTEPYLELVAALATLPSVDLPSVLSISYGVNEQLLSRDYTRHVCDVFGQLAARGVSVLAASGDFGPGQSCQANDGSGATRFLPGFPASCPYVTAVGATRTVGSLREEMAANFSSGGFSEHFARPAYQDGAVDVYLAKHGAEWNGLYNPDGRGIPDVAALGHDYQVYSHGKVESAGGTSASTPVLAAMVAVLNSLRAEKGKPTMGFLNTWLYKSGRFAFDEYASTLFPPSVRVQLTLPGSITTGKTSGCPGTSYAGLDSPKVPGAGWPADSGWDAATGLGTPIFARLRRLACV